MKHFTSHITHVADMGTCNNSKKNVYISHDKIYLSKIHSSKSSCDTMVPEKDHEIHFGYGWMDGWICFCEVMKGHSKLNQSFLCDI